MNGELSITVGGRVDLIARRNEHMNRYYGGAPRVGGNLRSEFAPDTLYYRSTMRPAWHGIRAIAVAPS